MDGFLVTNAQREFVYLSAPQLVQFLGGDLDKESALYRELSERGFICDEPAELFASRMARRLRAIHRHHFWGTTLHIFVLTNECNLQCVYCQAQKRRHGDTKRTHMTLEVARRSVDLALQSPATNLTFEFQGGEPLLNFPALREVVLYGRERAEAEGKQVKFDLVTNLCAMSREKLNFVVQHGVSICASLDGPPDVHDANRPTVDGSGSFQSVAKWIPRVREAVSQGSGQNLRFNAIATLTKHSLDSVERIIDLYIDYGFRTVSLRSLSPLGLAIANWARIGYSPKQFIEAYRRGLSYIVARNLSGDDIREDFANMVVAMAIQKACVNHMEMRSPCGAAIGQLAYHWNGDVYPCDEARMLGEMGDSVFKLGNVSSSTYHDCLASDTVGYLSRASCVESVPYCQGCAYSPFCGVCPVISYHRTGQLSSGIPDGYRCATTKGQLNAVFELLHSPDPAVRNAVSNW